MMAKRRKSQAKSSYLEGQLLIAMPSMNDRRFVRSVIYLCAHSAEGAMGIIINQRARHISFPELLTQLRIHPERRRRASIGEMPVHVGGPVENGRGFVLHSADYFAQESTLSISESVCLTATIDILKAIAQGRGPDRAILALGYAGWSPGQLENEIQSNGWLHCPADLDLVFGSELERKYEQALSKIGINPTHLVSEAGHA